MQEFYELAVLVGFVVLGTALVFAGVMAVAARMDPSAGGCHTTATVQRAPCTTA